MKISIDLLQARKYRNTLKEELQLQLIDLHQLTDNDNISSNDIIEISDDFKHFLDVAELHNELQSSIVKHTKKNKQ